MAFPTQTIGKIKCCDCDSLITPNPSNMCVECLRKYLRPPDQWVICELESKELLTFCLKKIKSLKQVHLIDATFVWTEPHSKRIKVKLTIQKETHGVILQQEFVIEYIVRTLMCSDCHKNEAKNFWKAVVQLRQRVQHKKTFFYLEQLILKFNMHLNCINIKSSHAGVDFYFAKKDDARKMTDFFMQVVPCKYITSQQLISHDTHSNTFDYKYTYSVEIVPYLQERFTNSIYLIDPRTLQIADVSSQQYWREPFRAIGSLKQCTEYTVMETNYIQDYERIKFAGQGRISQKHVLSDVWVVRSSELGLTESFMHSRTHLGHLFFFF
ncbi:60S ribosomal export protein NMD3 [Caerostris extrusa]|uniref:60S ribosomal export protein NMD3 n=1 Tax=Caerostris extrusa TaxID=172846 RepID=A0AAV4S3P3_CAEEX|nr:60S ribosomal export protein NMD3 [Caerostris extrusa]